MPCVPIHDENQKRRQAEAAVWRVRLVEAELESSAEFEAWLAEHPGNAAAWEQVNEPWAFFGEQATAPELMIARRDALDRARRAQARRLDRRPNRLLAVACLVAAVLLAGVGWSWRLGQPDVYRTALGERRSLVLADGSRVSLDSQTVLKVRLSRDARKLELVRGQARFDVAHDVTRPFIVTARSQTVVATGTSFDVDLLGRKVMVTLIEGRVSVLRNRRHDFRSLMLRPALDTQTRLRAGERLTATDEASPAAAPKIEEVNTDAATAWESGQLVFDDEPLASVAERVGQYSTRPLKVDAGAADLKVSGVFNAGDVATFVDTVQRYLPVVVRDDGAGAIEISRRVSHENRRSNDL